MGGSTNHQLARFLDSIFRFSPIDDVDYWNLRGFVKNYHRLLGLPDFGWEHGSGDVDPGDVHVFVGEVNQVRRKKFSGEDYLSI